MLETRIKPHSTGAMLVNRRLIPPSATVGHWQARDGWPLRCIRWTPPIATFRGSLLFLGGRGDHFEKYLEAFDNWQADGWQVESCDWRGQGGSGRQTENPHIGHADDFATWIDDLADYCADWQTRCPGPHVIIGHSMGGHLLLRALAEQRIAPDAAVLVAPMLGFTAPYPNWLGHWVATAMTKLGKPERAAWSASEKPGSPARLRQLLLTHDDARYADEEWWHAEHPELVLGPASWRWVEQAYASFLHMAQQDRLEAVLLPVLLLATTADKLVSPTAIKNSIARISDVVAHLYGRESAHEILREADSIRADALERIASFLDKRAPPP